MIRMGTFMIGYTKLDKFSAYKIYHKTMKVAYLK